MIHKTVTRPRATRSRSRRVRVGAALATAVAVAATVVGCGTPQSAPAPPGSAPPAPAEPAALTGANVNTWLDGLLPAALARTGVAGASVAVVRDGETLTARGYGHADTGVGDAAAVPVDPDRHLFRVGSVSKLVTATAALQLVQSGKLQLDTDIGEYLDFTVPRRYPQDVTLRHLLTHTAGFEERIAGLIGTTGTDVDLRAALINDPPEQIYEPGTVPAYSNYGNALAGYLVERASGLRFEEYVASNVLARAGMASSTFEQPLPPHLSDRMSNGYERAGAPAAPFEIVSTPPAGALSAPATDMARFMLAQLGEQVGEAPLLDAPTRELMQRPALDATSLGTLAEGPRMTLGYFDESRNGHRILGHGGDTRYFHSHLQLYPDDRTGIYLSLNSTGEGALDSHELRQAVLNGFADRYFPAGATRQVAGTQPVADVDPATAAEHAALAAGTYESSRAVRSNFLTMMGLVGRTTVSVADGDRLLFEPAPLSDSPALYEEVSPWVWREVGGQRTVAMRVTDGQVEAISFDSAFALLPVPAERDSALVLTVLAASTVVLLLVALSWPVRAIVRRRLGRAPRDRAGRTARILTRVAVAGTLLALAGWAVSLVSIMGLQDVSATSLRVVQLMQLIGLLGVLPAAVRLVDDIRRRTGWHRITGGVAVLLALAGTGWFAVEFMLLAPSISY
ncbi:serine hydrolase domain-containing protein [Verrucosispora sp. WMMD1129]|uniref:serine hydrolase domain-containing protein n=1 Tax=Verrucosispora sp. WMMD1129 TaxID=3016093 RepID=UPI002499B6C8|nr:serine hydrolase domain-containing protein [Verrucosispora sp. WMMD1129]WFE47905.1 serine hydrolase [Verrucosispora sp. WMMD1129]